MSGLLVMMILSTLFVAGFSFTTIGAVYSVSITISRRGRVISILAIILGWGMMVKALVDYSNYELEKKGPEDNIIIEDVEYILQEAPGSGITLGIVDK